MKAVVGILISALILFSCGPKEAADGSHEITIKGKVNFPQKGKILLEELRPDGKGWKDSVVLDSDNSFEKKIRITEPGYYLFNFYNLQTQNLILYKNDVSITVDGRSQEGKVEIKGSPEYEVVMKVQEMVQAQSSAEIIALQQEFGKATKAGDTVTTKRIQEEYIAIIKKNTDAIANYIKDQPASLALVEILGPGRILPPEEYSEVYAGAVDKLKKELPNSVFVKPFLDQYEKSKSTAIGSVAPEISMPDPSGKVIALSSLRGKYVLVDFWAKWCGPCRRENPNVVKAYHKYKSKGFEVFGVSLDRDKADWVEAIKEDHLDWTQVSDLKYTGSQAANDYNVSGIPFSVLLDPKGVIIAKNLRGPALDKKLAELFK